MSTIANIPLDSAIPFPIPASDMTLEFQSLGRSISPPRVNALLLIAAVAVDHDVDIHGENTPSAGEEFKYSLDQGVELWLVKIFRPPLGYMTYGRIRTVITGLQLYIVLGRRPQAVTFRVLSGADSKVLGYGAVGDLVSLASCFFSVALRRHLSLETYCISLLLENLSPTLKKDADSEIM